MEHIHNNAAVQSAAVAAEAHRVKSEWHLNRWGTIAASGAASVAATLAIGHGHIPAIVEGAQTYRSDPVDRVVAVTPWEEYHPSAIRAVDECVRNVDVDRFITEGHTPAHHTPYGIPLVVPIPRRRRVNAAPIADTTPPLAHQAVEEQIITVATAAPVITERTAPRQHESKTAILASAAPRTANGAPRSSALAVGIEAMPASAQSGSAGAGSTLERTDVQRSAVTVETSVAPQAQIAAETPVASASATSTPAEFDAQPQDTVRNSHPQERTRRRISPVMALAGLTAVAAMAAGADVYHEATFNLGNDCKPADTWRFGACAPDVSSHGSGATSAENGATSGNGSTGTAQGQYSAESPAAICPGTTHYTVNTNIQEFVNGQPTYKYTNSQSVS